ncbi:MAG: SusC/RagA family TonB-linked outer membrane protein [Bacteroidaceae bacterium]|nr:SusC/RagA family TonB-linked outer membrane protein [Bacteroidaceae bacterium]
MKNTLSNKIMSKAHRVCLCFMALAAFGISTSYAQEAQENETANERRVKKAPKHETRTVKGRVIDSANGAPMGGVRVQALGMNRYSTLTNEDGTYEVEIPVFINTVYVYAPEYNPLQVAINEKATDIEMMSSTFGAFYGEGTEITAKNATTLDQTSSLTIETDMMNKLAGDINIVKKNGLPGQGAYMTIRGINSINADAQPLVVLDGNIIDMQYDRTAQHEGYFNNVLAGIDPETVESVQVLKNGTAIYGAKGANGVIIITTKRGKSQATKINARIYGGVELMPNKLSVMDGPQYTTYLGDLVSTIKDMNQNKLNSFVFLDQSPSNFYRNIYNNNTDWQDGMYRVAATQNYKISVEGGDDVGMYALSLGYTDAQSTMKNNDMSRLNLRFNTDIEISSKLSTALDISYNQTSYNILDNGWSESYDKQNIGSVNVLGLVQAPFISPYSYYVDTDANGRSSLKLSGDWAGKYASSSTNSEYVKNPFMFSKHLSEVNEVARNPYWILENGKGNNKNFAEMTQININVAPKYQISKDWAISDRFNYTLNRNNEKYFLPIAGATPYLIQDQGNITSVLKSQFTKQTTLNNDLRIEYGHQWDEHTFGAFAGWRFNSYNYSYSYLNGYNNENDKLPNITKNMQFINSSGVNDSWKDMTYYLQANYNYANRYFAEFAASAQASSRFGSHAKDGFRLAGVSWGFFPSLQLGWVLTNEKWFKPTRNVNYLKATFGIEKNGNDNLDYYAARTYWETAQVFENVFGKYLSNIANSELQWETVRKINVGVEGSFFNNRLNGRVDLFWNKTSDMLSMRDLSDQYYYSGITNFWTNEGEMTNSGVEVKLNSALINSKNWKWELGATLGHYRNEVTALPESKDNTIELYKRDADGKQYGEPEIIHGYTSSVYGKSNVLTAVGYSAGTFYGWEVNYDNESGTGVYASEAEASRATSAFGAPSKLRYYTGVAGSYREFGAGDMAFVDQNGDGWIDESDKVALGNATPDIYGNIFTNLTWKNLRLDVIFKYSLGNDIYNYQRSRLESGNTTYNQTTAMARRWTYEGQVTDMPRACFTNNLGYVENERMSSRWIEDGSYLKMKNIRLTYNVPYHNSWLQGIKVWGEANDVFCITKYLGTDPETSAQNGTLYQGIDAGRIPSGRSFNLGVSLNL